MRQRVSGIFITGLVLDVHFYIFNGYSLVKGVFPGLIRLELFLLQFTRYKKVSCIS